MKICHWWSLTSNKNNNYRRGGVVTFLNPREKKSKCFQNLCMLLTRKSCFI